MFLPTSAVLAVDAPTAACAAPEHLPLVDSAYARPNAESAALMQQLCRTCPVAATCLEHALDNPEDGVWAGTSKRARTRARKEATARRDAADRARKAAAASKERKAHQVREAAVARKARKTAER